MKLYAVEVTDDTAKMYRFVSLLDGTRGTYNYKKEEAIAQGEAHQKILCAILPELNNLVDDNPETEIKIDPMKSAKVISNL